MLDAEGKHSSEFTHSLAVPAASQAAPWSSPMGFSIIHQCLHYSPYLLAWGKCSLSGDERSQYSTNTQLVDTGKVFSPVLPPRRHASRVVSATVGAETPKNTTGQDLHTRAEPELGGKFCPRNKRRDVDSVLRLSSLKMNTRNYLLLMPLGHIVRCIFLK